MKVIVRIQGENLKLIFITLITVYIYTKRQYAVTQLVEALFCKLGGCGFDSR